MHHKIGFQRSQKLQMRILPIIRDNLKLNRSTNFSCFSLASWMEFIRRAVNNKAEIMDPMAAEFNANSDLLSENIEDAVKAFLSIDSIFGTDLIDNDTVTKQLVSHLTALQSADQQKVISLLEKL